MKTEPVSSKLYAIISLYDMQTDYFGRVLDGIDDKDTHNRLDTKANHIAWLAGELVEQRFGLAELAGLEKRSSAHDLFRDNQGIKENVQYPSLSVYKSDWEEITPALREKLLALSDADLERKIDMGPEYQFPLYDMITFSSYREANMIGQIALYRRLLGYQAMNYM
jgi:hypothetical protein